MPAHKNKHAYTQTQKNSSKRKSDMKRLASHLRSHGAGNCRELGFQLWLVCLERGSTHFTWPHHLSGRALITWPPSSCYLDCSRSSLQVFPLEAGSYVVLVGWEECLGKPLPSMTSQPVAFRPHGWGRQSAGAGGDLDRRSGPLTPTLASFPALPC